MKIIILVILCVLLNGCSGFSLLISGSSIAISQNIYSKAYSGADILTIIKTDKSIKEHAYDKIKKK
jgi:hypothetical protein